MEIKPGHYRHYSGKEYDVLGIAKHSETLEVLVLYKARYGEKLMWVRPIEMFKEDVTVDGVSQPRFKFLD